MFGLIDEDAATAAFDQAVADGFKPEPDDDRPVHQRENDYEQVNDVLYDRQASKYDPYEGRDCDVAVIVEAGQNPDVAGPAVDVHQRAPAVELYLIEDEQL